MITRSNNAKHLSFILSSISITVLFVVLAVVVVAVNTHLSVYAFEKATEYKFIKKWGGAGSGDGQFLRPHDLDFSPDEKILYAVDRDGARVQAFDKDGKFIILLGEKGKGEGQFFLQPRHVKIDKDLKYVYVSDSKNHRISIFDINGNFVKVVGKLGNKSGEFNLPTTLEIDSKGNFYVNERGNERIQKFDSNWNPILMWGSKGSGDNQFCHMEHIALDKYDNVYVTDPQSDPGCSQQPRVLKFDSEGKFITKWGTKGKGDGQFLDPEHLAVDSEGNVYVSDRKKDDIQKFAPVGGETSSSNEIIGTSTSNNNLISSTSSPQSETPKKMDTTNVLSAMAPKLANTTKIIDTKAWDKLIGQ